MIFNDNLHKIFNAIKDAIKKLPENYFDDKDPEVKKAFKLLTDETRGLVRDDRELEKAFFLINKFADAIDQKEMSFYGKWGFEGNSQAVEHFSAILGIYDQIESLTLADIDISDDQLGKSFLDALENQRANLRDLTLNEVVVSPGVSAQLGTLNLKSLQINDQKEAREQSLISRTSDIIEAAKSLEYLKITHWNSDALCLLFKDFLNEEEYIKHVKTLVLNPNTDESTEDELVVLTFVGANGTTREVKLYEFFPEEDEDDHYTQFYELIDSHKQKLSIDWLKQNYWFGNFGFIDYFLSCGIPVKKLSLSFTDSEVALYFHEQARVYKNQSHKTADQLEIFNGAFGRYPRLIKTSAATLESISLVNFSFDKNQFNTLMKALKLCTKLDQLFFDSYTSTDCGRSQLAGLFDLDHSVLTKATLKFEQMPQKMFARICKSIERAKYLRSVSIEVHVPSPDAVNTFLRALKANSKIVFADLVVGGICQFAFEEEILDSVRSNRSISKLAISVLDGILGMSRSNFSSLKTALETFFETENRVFSSLVFNTDKDTLECKQPVKQVEKELKKFVHLGRIFTSGRFASSFLPAEMLRKILDDIFTPTLWCQDHLTVIRDYVFDRRTLGKIELTEEMGRNEFYVECTRVLDQLPSNRRMQIDYIC